MQTVPSLINSDIMVQIVQETAVVQMDDVYMHADYWKPFAQKRTIVFVFKIHIQVLFAYL